MSQIWKIPAHGDIVWCLSPEIPDIKPGPKPRPAFVLSLERRDDGDQVSVVYGTSRHLMRLKTGEVQSWSISRILSPVLAHGGNHSSRSIVTNGLELSTRRLSGSPQRLPI